MERTNRAEDRCPKTDMCQRLADDGVAFECPRITNRSEASQYFGRSQTVLAERLCIRALTEYPQVSSNKDPYKQTFNDAIYNLEVAFAHFDETERSQHFEAFKRQKQEMLATNPDVYADGRLAYYIRAQLLNIFTPAYSARVENRRPSVEEMSLVHVELCAWIKDFEDNILSKIPKDQHHTRKLAIHFRTEAEMAALLTRLRRSELFPWPALPREEASHINSEYNHDYYTIDDDGLKHPLQFKTSKRTGGYKVPIVTHQAILHAAKRGVETTTYAWEDDSTSWPPERHRFEQKLVPPLVPTIRDLLLEEAHYGRRMLPEHRSLLNLASVHVASTVEGYVPAS